MNNKRRQTNLIGLFLGLISLAIGIILVIWFLLDLELIISFLTLMFGLVAVFWTIKAKNAFSKGSSIKVYATNLFVALICLLVYSIWRIITIFMPDPRLAYFEYFFIAVTYLVFVTASYRMLRLGKEFGFGEEAKRIKKVMGKKKR